MIPGGAFITQQEFEERWRPLSTAELLDAADLLGAAGRWIRSELPEIDDNNPDAIFVSIDVVKTAMSTGAYAGHISYSRTTGPRTKAGTLANPGGALIFTDWHKKLLGISTGPAPQFYFGDGC
ncbi:hypothetical protein ACHIPZ_13835 [Antrihabitans sp. NCIMB 15449]|uniref:Head-to-tail adaptor n=1 Tax=Antrihabitans spumae TaxID=3373370 RepID=A0ABW7JMQ2_9NOCA